VSGGAVAISWVRCARIGGDTWGPGEPPMGATDERHQLYILDGDTVRRSVEIMSPAYLYGAGDQTTDFGSLPGSLRIRVAQTADNGGRGLNKELTITL
jgi:hypothetical protein